MRTLTELLDHGLLDDLPELADTGEDALLLEVELDALDLLIGHSGFTTAADLVADVPHLDSYRRRRLLEAFPTVSALLAATPADVAALPGFGPGTASRVHATVRATVKAA